MDEERESDREVLEFLRAEFEDKMSTLEPDKQQSFAYETFSDNLSDTKACDPLWIFYHLIIGWFDMPFNPDPFPRKTLKRPICAQLKNFCQSTYLLTVFSMFSSTPPPKLNAH